MTIESINITKDELYNLVREAIRDEIHNVDEISEKEQLELENLHGKIPSEFKLDLNECIEL